MKHAHSQIVLWRLKFGQKAEKEAWKFLKKKGYRLRNKNYRSNVGEIDLVVQKYDLIVFVEVKALTYHRHFYAEDHYNFKKRKKQILLAQDYLSSLSTEYQARFDLITVVKKAGDFFIEHYENVIHDV